jgi:hypothetical protein
MKYVFSTEVSDWLHGAFLRGLIAAQKFQTFFKPEGLLPSLSEPLPLFSLHLTILFL